jgi:hypothetical protein
LARLYTGAEVIENWNVLDDIPMPEYLPLEWNGPHVYTRLTDAWRTLSKMPLGQFRPRSYGSAWPSYQIEWRDLLAMAEQDGQQIQAYYRRANRVRILPSAKEISQMETGIGWPLQYLLTPRSILIVNVCARVASFNGDLQREIRRRKYKGNAEHWQRLNWKYCDWIADGLMNDRVAVF